MMAENEGAFSWLRSEQASGWGDVNREGLSKEEADEQQAALLLQWEMAKLAHDVFAIGRGPELLEHIRDMTIEWPMVRVSGAVGHADLDMAITPDQWLWIRTGQNSMYFWLRGLLEQARKGPPRVAAADGEGE